MEAYANSPKPVSFDYAVTPEAKALIARRTLLLAIKSLCLIARGNGVTDDRIKALIFFLRTPEIAVLTDEKASILICDLELESA